MSLETRVFVLENFIKIMTSRHNISDDPDLIDMLLEYITSELNFNANQLLEFRSKAGLNSNSMLIPKEYASRFLESWNKGKSKSFQVDILVRNFEFDDELYMKYSDSLLHWTHIDSSFLRFLASDTGISDELKISIFTEVLKNNPPRGRIISDSGLESLTEGYGELPEAIMLLIQTHSLND